MRQVSSGPVRELPDNQVLAMVPDGEAKILALGWKRQLYPFMFPTPAVGWWETPIGGYVYGAKKALQCVGLYPVDGGKG